MSLKQQAQQQMKTLPLLLAAILLASGCTAGNPTIAADNAAMTKIEQQIAALSPQIDSVKAQIATASTQPAATQPSIADSTPLLTRLDTKLDSLQSQSDTLKLQADAQAKKANADSAAIKDAQVKEGIQVATGIANLAPSPWGPIAAWVIGAGALIYTTSKQTAATQTVSANAAATQQTASTNHAATVGKFVDALANSVPASLSPDVKTAIQAGAAVFDAVAGTTTTTTTTTPVAVTTAPIAPGIPPTA